MYIHVHSHTCTFTYMYIYIHVSINFSQLFTKTTPKRPFPTSDYPASHKSDFAELNRDYKYKFQQPSQKLRLKTNYKTETTEENIGSALIPTGHIVDRINFDRVLKTLPKDEKFRAPPSRESVFQGKPADLFGKLGSLAKNEVDKTAEI